MRRKVLIPVVIVVILLVALGATLGPLALSGPRLVSATPADGIADVSPQSTLQLTFDQWVSPAKVQQAVKLDPAVPFTVEGSTSPKLGGSTVTIKPTGGLKYDTRYRISIDPSLSNLVGRGLAQAEEINFATMPLVAVKNFAPAGDAQNVPLRAPITVEFAQGVVSAAQVAAAALDPAKADALPQPLTLTPQTPGVGRWLSPTLYGFYPADGLLAATDYTAALPAELSKDGALMEKAVSWRFRTETGPLVVSTRPYNGAENVSANGVLEIQLAPGVDGESVKQLFTLTNTADGSAVTGNTKIENNVLRFEPQAPLARGVRYQASIAPGARTTSGAALNDKALQWEFGVIGDPSIVAVEPQANTNEVITDTRRITVRFNQPIVALTDVAGQAQLPGAGANGGKQPLLQITPALAGDGRWIDASTYVYSPTAALAPGTNYRVAIAAGLTDRTGGTLRDAFSWTFATITPQVAQSTPLPDEQYVSPQAPLVVNFNQPMDAASLQGALRLVRDNGAEVAGTITGQGTTATFTPAAPLERGASYVLNVGTNALTVGGGGLRTAYALAFRVAPLPVVVETTPGAAENITPGSEVSLVFSTPMDWATVERNLQIDPKPTQIYTFTYDTRFGVSFPQAPETAYRVTLAGAASDPYGVALGQDFSYSFRTGSLSPRMTLVGGYQIGAYNAVVPVKVPVRTVNTPRVDYVLSQLQPTEALPYLAGVKEWSAYEAPDAAFANVGQLETGGERNTEQIDTIDFGALAPGLYLLDIAGEDNQTDRQFMVVSRHTLTIKRSTDELFAWMVDLGNGKPVADVPLVVVASPSYNTDGERTPLLDPQSLGRTAADGVLQADFSPLDVYGALFVWGGEGDNFVFSSTAWGDGINAWEFNLPNELNRNTVVGNVYTDRPLYRPEQTVHLRGAVRVRAGEQYAVPPTGEQVFLAINDPNGTTIFSSTLPLSAFGTFNGELAIERSAPLGSYSMAVSLPAAQGTNSYPTIYGSFTVAEYRKPTVELTITPSKAEAVQGETVQMTAEARYFSGGVVRNRPVTWRLYAEPLSWTSERNPGFVWQDVEDAYAFYRWFDTSRFPSREFVGEGKGMTDGQGRYSVTLPAQLGRSMDSQRVILDVELKDVDGQVVAGQGFVNVNAGAFYLGVRPDGYVAQVGQNQAVALLALDLEEQPVANQEVAVNILRRDWYSTNEQGVDGNFYFTSRYTDTLETTQKVTTDAQGRATIQFKPQQSSSYRIQAQAQDAGGRTIKASAYTWAYGGDAGFWGVNDTNRIDLIADKTSYNIGDTARILIPAPYEGMTGLVTIERGTVLEHRLIDLPTTTQVVEIPITGDYTPNVFVSVVLLKTAGDLPAPELRVGLVNLPVSTAAQELNVSITPDKTTAGPRETVTYTIKTTDSTGKGVAAEVGLALVDKALLALATDPNRTFLQAFYEKRPLGVQTSQSLTILVDRMRLRLQEGDKGGGGGAAGAFVRRDVPDTAYWNPAVVTDVNGSATISVTLPDNLTTWRLNARGITADTRVGQATNDLLATRPLYIRPSLPRFLTVGDTLSLVAVVHNGSNQEVAATVTLDPGGLKVDAPAVQTITLPPDSDTVVRWPATALTAGPSKLSFSVTGGGQSDAIEQTLPVQRFTSTETTATSGQVLEQSVETIQPTQAQSGELTLELAPSLAAGVAGGLTYLDDYPYAASEHTASRILPNAATYRILAQLGKDNPALKTKLDTQISAGLQRLYALQNLDGGWGWWADEDSDVYLSAYVMQSLIEARKAGYSIAQTPFENGLAYLDKALAAAPTLPSAAPRAAMLDAQAAALNTRAYVLFVLSEAGQADRGRSVTLYDERAKLTIAGRAHLLMALHTLGAEQNDRVQTLVGDLMSSAILHTTDAHWEEAAVDVYNLGSDTRTTALALQALVRVDPTNFLVPNTVRFLMSARDQNHWESTQASATTLLALAEYLGASDELSGDYSYRVALDGTTVSEGQVSAATLADPIQTVIDLANVKAGGSQLAIQRQAAAGQTGAGRLYYTLRLRTMQPADQVQARDQGFGVERAYIAVDTATLSPTGQLLDQLEVGGLVQVRLRVTVPENMRYVAFEDMLPAGLEALDTSLLTVSAAAQAPTLDNADGDLPYWAYWNQSEVRDNRVALFATDLPKGVYDYTYLARATTAGTFQTLPARAYQMYQPEVFGRSDGTRFVINEAR